MTSNVHATRLAFCQQEFTTFSNSHRESASIGYACNTMLLHLHDGSCSRNTTEVVVLTPSRLVVRNSIDNIDTVSIPFGIVEY